MLTGRLDYSICDSVNEAYRADYTTEIKMVKSGEAAMEVCPLFVMMAFAL
jgi:hypothetical protein